jgi:hypothetical protein
VSASETITAISAIIGAVVTVLTYLGVTIKVSGAWLKRVAQSLALGVGVGVVVFAVGMVASAAMADDDATSTTSTSTTSASTTTTSTTSTTVPAPTVEITSLRLGSEYRSR